MAKSKYEQWLEPDNLLLLRAWARDGLTYEQIANNMSISLATLKEWRKKYPAITTALKVTRELADIEVENALYKTAVGFTSTNQTIYEDADGVQTFKTDIIYNKPDKTAQIFWLKNRKPKQWRDVWKTEISGELSINDRTEAFAEALANEQRKLQEDT